MSDAMKEDLRGVEVIAFDAVGTLIFPARPVAEVYVESAARLGQARDARVVAERFAHAARWRIDASQFDSPDLATTEQIERDWWRELIADVLELDHAQSMAAFDFLWDHYAQPQSWRFFDDAAECLRRLGEAGVRWIIASNFDERLRAICRREPLLAKAERVFPSSEVGWRKPSGRFYDYIRREMAVSPEKLLMVGDDSLADVEGARRAGWRAMLLRRDDQRVETGAGVLTSLADLPPRLAMV